MLKMGESVYLQFNVNATDLSAGTTQYLVAPITGHVSRWDAVTNVAIVTGGTLKIKNAAAVEMVSDTLTFANSEVVATHHFSTFSPGDASLAVTKGDVLTIIVDSAFTGGGAVNGMVEFKGGMPSGEHAGP